MPVITYLRSRNELCVRVIFNINKITFYELHYVTRQRDLKYDVGMRNLSFRMFVRTCSKYLMNELDQLDMKNPFPFQALKSISTRNMKKADRSSTEVHRNQFCFPSFITWFIKVKRTQNSTLEPLRLLQTRKREEKWLMELCKAISRKWKDKSEGNSL